MRLLIAIMCLILPSLSSAQDTAKIEAIKNEVTQTVENNKKMVQEIVDSLFSFSELGFQEYETQRYLSDILLDNGFRVEKDVAGLPSGWVAKWGSGHPVIALGTDVDGIPKASQKPGVAYKDPMIEGAPGHGEGHNSGMAVIIAAALSMQDVMMRENLPGTIMIWPGIAEELLAGKAFMTREGVFDEVDAVLFTHVSGNLGVSWGKANGTGLISVEYTFKGESSHSAGAPWRGKSALDAVELMNAGWNARREHLHPLQRSHYIISDGGDQPNVVPQTASVWYYIREMTAEKILENYEKLNKTAEGAALMTDTTVSHRVVGGAWPRHFNKAIAEAVDKNIQVIGMPEWDQKDQTFARAVQRLADTEPTGLKTEVNELSGPSEYPISGGSDDIGDISWLVPTINLRFPANINNLGGHNWRNTIAMATPVAHKGSVVGAKVIARTLVDLFMDPQILADAKRYFNDVQLKEATYVPFISATEKPAIEKNVDIMAKFKPELEKLYYDPKRYNTYLEQLGIEYPTLP
ncbi:amidohydrolase [Pseudemcibacter aquimaris]|uniref:amidohydrolase n=1 Tax=Pseudemcibacter aquimaris TaxID=2857064 RepID=UPI002013161D|nr:amidohydrolase [Pseudemcibacter aquimaris]MCC3862073.1 amidohydrolase [Pseudemcibacter aquimaris]WDU58825.1 amidohydrolase [Pseudemcibacter aquimaris]